MRRLALICAAAFLTSSGWAATYTFTGSNYTTTTDFTSCTAGACANFTTSMNLSGSFTVAAPLGTSLVNQNIASQLTSYSFSDGITTFASTDPNSRIFDFVVSTGASGNITSAEIFLEEWQSGASPHMSGDRVALVFIGAGGTTLAYDNASAIFVGTAPSGVADASTITTPDDATSIANGPSGTWMVSVPTPTLGEWETIFLGGLLVTFALLRLRRQERGTPAA